MKEQFLNGLNDETITPVIIKELTALIDTSQVSSVQVLMWAKRVESDQKAVVDNILDAIDFDLIQRDRQTPGQDSQHKVSKKREIDRELYRLKHRAPTENFQFNSVLCVPVCGKLQ